MLYRCVPTVFGDSFSVSAIWFTDCPRASWMNTVNSRSDNASAGLGAPFKFLQSGAHTIRIQQREDGVSIDEILLSPSAYFSKSPGLAKQDTTMFKATQTPQ